MDPEDDDDVDQIAPPEDAAGVAVRREGRVARVSLDPGGRPFTLTLDSVGALLRVWSWVAEAGVSVVVVSGNEKAWCVGGDITAFAGSERPQDYIDELADHLHRLISEITRAGAVCIAAVDGVVAGAGTPLAAAADVLIATDRARFTLGYTKIALSPDGGTSLLTATVGLHATLYAALLNPTWTAEEAHRRGLVAEVVPPSALSARCGEVARQLAALPAAPLAATKRLIREHALPDPETALRRELLGVREAAATGDAREAFRAFLEKRPPRFGT